jgi:hypothetical protein
MVFGGELAPWGGLPTAVLNPDNLEFPYCIHSLMDKYNLYV